MASKTSKTPTVASGDVLGNVVCWLATDTRVIAPTHAEVQTVFIASCFGAQPDRARLFAAMAFQNRRAA